MNLVTDVNHLLGRIRLFDIRSYLEQKGWQNVTTRNDRWNIFQLEEGGESIELILPSQERFIDVQERIVQTILSLSQIEERTTDEICSAIVGTNVDSLFIRLQIPSNKSSIPVEEASQHVNAIKDLIRFSACSEINAKPYYEKALSASNKIIKDFEFCHTFEGSFGFEVSSPVIKPQDAGTDDLSTSMPQQLAAQTPKSRLVIERLARGLILLDEAVKNDDPDVLTQSYKTAFNSKMCDAITEISINGKVVFNLGIKWASLMPPTEDVRSFSERVINEPQINMLKHVSEQLKIVRPYPDYINGLVVNLHCIGNPTEDLKRTITLKVKHENHGSIDVKMDLGANEYLLAIDAHTDGKYLSATGQLQRKGGMWLLNAITSLKIDDHDDQ